MIPCSKLILNLLNMKMMVSGDWTIGMVTSYSIVFASYVSSPLLRLHAFGYPLLPVYVDIMAPNSSPSSSLQCEHFFFPLTLSILSGCPDVDVPDGDDADPSTAFLGGTCGPGILPAAAVDVATLLSLECI